MYHRLGKRGGERFIQSIQVELGEFVCREECPARGYGSDDHGPNALVETPEEHCTVDDGDWRCAMWGGIYFLEVGGLESGFECIERVDEKIDGERCDGACLEVGKVRIGELTAQIPKEYLRVRRRCEH